MYKQQIDITSVSTDVRGLIQSAITEINAKSLSTQIFSRFESTKNAAHNYTKYVLNILPDETYKTMLAKSLSSALLAWDASKAHNDRDRYFDYLGGLFITIPDIVKNYAVTTTEEPSLSNTWDPFQQSLYQWVQTVDQNLIVQTRTSSEKPFLLNNYEIRVAISSKILAFHDYKMLREAHLSIFHDQPLPLTEPPNAAHTTNAKVL